LSPRAQLFWQVVITSIVVLWGWRIAYISQPFSSGIIRLDTIALGPLVLPGSILTILWLLLLMNAINWLDGVDGLATAVSIIALMTLALLTLLPSIQDSRTLTIALLGSGAAIGFLIWNFPPARVFLGTSGSWFLGLYIGLVAILTGGKIVTTLLVLAIPVVDLFFVIIQRLLTGQPPWQGDKNNHLHHRLLNVGLSPRTIVIFASVLSLLLAYGALTLQTRQKIIALFVAVIMLSLLSIQLLWLARKS
jgi:UDP-GlcNAc:undecaprenyl-phosphate GlcNAc-1-phosphate transferase